jgi:S-adenosylmethionine hydrolase
LEDNMVRVNGLITLTTDFETRDGYVGSMKGVITSIDPELDIVDITHSVPRQDIRAGALCLRNASLFFPPGTVHVAVIDPGVGTKRSAIVARTDRYYYVLPDNGLLSHLEEVEPISEVRRVENLYWCRDTISHSFHGRDIFAPVAAHLAAGAVFEDVGHTQQTWVRLPIPEFKRMGRECHGEVLDIDVYGNLITNISRELIDQAEVASVKVANVAIEGLETAYEAVDEGAILAIMGSRDCIEISVNGGSAAARLGITRGEPVHVLLK